MFRVFPQDHWLLFGRYLVAIFATCIVLVAIWSLFVGFGCYLVAILTFWSLFGRYLVTIFLFWSLFVGFGPNSLAIGVSMLAHITLAC